MEYPILCHFNNARLEQIYGTAISAKLTLLIKTTIKINCEIITRANMDKKFWHTTSCYSIIQQRL